jgi:hypothetical protein
VILDRIAHERAVPALVMDRGAGAVAVGRGAQFADVMLRFAREREADAVLVARVADRRDSALEDLSRAGFRAFEECCGRLLEVLLALAEIDGGAFEERVGVRFDQAREQCVVVERRVGLALLQIGGTSGADAADFFCVEDDVRITNDGIRFTVDELADADPDRSLLRLRREMFERLEISLGG